MNLSSEVLRDGDRARAVGRIVCADDRYGLLHDFGQPLRTDIVMDQSAVVELTGLDDELVAWLGSGIGSRAAVHGRWTGASIEVGTGGHLELLKQPPPRDDLTVRPSRVGQASKDRSIAQAPLWADGILLSLITATSNEAKYHAIVTDIAAAGKVLRPLYGNVIEYHLSRWSATTLSDLEKVVVNHAESIVSSFGEEHTHEHQIIKTAFIHHITASFARDLEPYSREAIGLSILVERV